MGEKNEKLQPYLAPLYDSLEVLMDCNRSEAIAHIQMLEEQGKFELEAISHIRGRSFQDTLIIIDEAENLDVSSLKTLLTRIGENCLIIVLSDDDQIDNLKLSAVSNGTALMKDKLIGQPLYAYIELQSSVRSPLAELVTKLMK